MLLLLLLQGIGAGFVPKNLKMELLDEVSKERTRTRVWVTVQPAHPPPHRLTYGGHAGPSSAS